MITRSKTVTNNKTNINTNITTQKITHEIHHVTNGGDSELISATNDDELQTEMSALTQEQINTLLEVAASIPDVLTAVEAITRQQNKLPVSNGMEPAMFSGNLNEDARAWKLRFLTWIELTGL
jgi:hypothetical protein